METVEDFTNRLRERAKLAGKVYFSWLGHKSIHLGQLICRSKEEDTHDARGSRIIHT
jgi:hypothetical protein